MVVRLRRMSWLDEQIAKAEEMQSKEALLMDHAPKIYEDLWQRLLKIVEEAKTKPLGLQFSAGGSSGERHLEAATPGIPMNDRMLDFRLSADDRIITVTIPGRPGTTFMFEIGIGDDGIVGLRREGVPIAEQDAAHLIMGTFLFPKIYGND